MKKNFIYNLIYQLLALALPIITVPYVSRVLGVDGVGTYSYTYSIVYYFMIIAMLGLNNYGNRTIAKVRDDKEKLSKEFSSIYAFQLITSIVMIVSYLMYIVLIDNQYKSIALMQTIYVISSMFDINWFFYGMEKFKLTITRNAIIKILSLVLIFIFVKTPNDVWKYTAILSGSTLFSNIILFSFLKKYVKFEKVNRKEILKHFKPCSILFLPVVAVSIYKMMDKIMLGSFSSIEEVGYYENAEKIIQLPITMVSALGTVMLPRVSNMIRNNKENEVKRISSKTLPFVTFLTIPIIMGLIAVGKDFSILFLGEKFKKSGDLIQLLVITVIFVSWGNVIRTQYLIPKERDKEYVASVFLGAIVNFIINYILIPKYQSVGACIGTIFAEFVVVLYQIMIIRKELEIRNYISNSIPFILKAIIMIIVVWSIGIYIDDRKILKIIVQIVCGGFIYLMLNIKYIYNDLGVKNIMSKWKGKKV